MAVWLVYHWTSYPYIAEICSILINSLHVHLMTEASLGACPVKDRGYILSMGGFSYASISGPVSNTGLPVGRRDQLLPHSGPALLFFNSGSTWTPSCLPTTRNSPSVSTCRSLMGGGASLYVCNVAISSNICSLHDTGAVLEGNRADRCERSSTVPRTMNCSALR